jgi:hypothetical protein
LTQPVIRRCPDGHFRRVIYDLIAFIADYPEQVTLAGIIQGWCAKLVSLSIRFDQSDANAIRCTASLANLDVNAICRTPTFTDGLAQVLDSKKLRKDYGIDDNVVVCPKVFVVVSF